MMYTSVSVTPAAQAAYLAKHPEVAASVAKKKATATPVSAAPAAGASATPGREPLAAKAKRDANDAGLDEVRPSSAKKAKV
jgi:hypothetical protein